TGGENESTCSSHGRTEGEGADEPCLHSLGYGGLGDLVPLLVDHRRDLEEALSRVDSNGTGHIKLADLMSCIRKAGVPLTTMQEANLRDLLERKGVVGRREEGEDQAPLVQWPHAVEALSVAAQRVRGSSMPGEECPSSALLVTVSRLMDTVQSRYRKLREFLLPSSLLAMRHKPPCPPGEGGGGEDKGMGGHVYVTVGTMRGALRSVGIVLGDSGERTLWRHLVRLVRERLVASVGGELPAGDLTYSLVGQGMIPLTLLDQVMGFQREDEAGRQRHRRPYTRQTDTDTPVVPCDQSSPCPSNNPFPGPYASSPDKEGGASGDAPILLQKARARVRALGTTVEERRRGLLECLPSHGPRGEGNAFPRSELICLLQRLGLGLGSGELQNLWYHVDRTNMTRAGMRGILLHDNVSMRGQAPPPPPHSASPGRVWGPSDPSPWGVNPDGVEGGTGAGDEGASSDKGATECGLSRAAYEENLRRAAGSGATYGGWEAPGKMEGVSVRVCDKVRTSKSPSPSSLEQGQGQGQGSKPEMEDDELGSPALPSLLQRAVLRAKELKDEREAFVMSLVPDMGRGKEGRRITRGGVHRVLHGLGIIPRAGEIEALWWALEGGGVGGPRITVSDFRDLLLGNVHKILLVPQWNPQVDDPSAAEDRIPGVGAGAGAGERARGANRDGRSGLSPEAEVMTALGLVRRRAPGLIRGCQDRDLSGDGWIGEGDFLAVLREQGVLQQLGPLGLPALSDAVVADMGVIGGRGEKAVRYTGIIGAIDRYLEA
ncbi:unnamed protein product, partial [Discosporangium mesarthrocarpum]